MYKLDIIFRNAIFAEILLEFAGIFAGWMVLAEVAVVALGTTMVLWLVCLREDAKLRKQQQKVVKKCI